ncbi:hypothetical protein [Herbaspirillum sp. B65]|uniref:hypothetical protein n=1 Tax=Herbaspirillum sp. B65 TaxID=137708 RepID=UPI0011D1EB6F|nr:hypothetical protein [Herbaspirillum sp. B65]
MKPLGLLGGFFVGGAFGQSLFEYARKARHGFAEVLLHGRSIQKNDDTADSAPLSFAQSVLAPSACRSAGQRENAALATACVLG